MLIFLLELNLKHLHGLIFVGQREAYHRNLLFILDFGGPFVGGGRDRGFNR